MRSWNAVARSGARNEQNPPMPDLLRLAYDIRHSHPEPHGARLPKSYRHC
ncbi:hypothetical protein GCM10022296_17980 [Secundilactobacillus similis DSM 23365 = JCM 2765]